MRGRVKPAFVIIAYSPICDTKHAPEIIVSIDNLFFCPLGNYLPWHCSRSLVSVSGHDGCWPLEPYNRHFFLNTGKWPYIDREGSMWWGYQDSVFVLKQSQLSKITVGSRVNAIVQDSTGIMWFFGHHSDSLIVSRYDGTIRETTKTQVKQNLIIGPPAVVDGKGRFWMRAEPLYRRSGGYPGYGIYEYSNNRWYHHTTATGLRHDRIYDLTVDQEGYPWAATLRSVSQYRDGQWHNFDRTDGLSNQKVYRIAIGKNGDIWCTHGNRDDISVYDGDKWRVINTDSGMPFGEVRAALYARDGTFWFGVHHDDITDPEQSGLVRFDGQSWLVLTERDGLPGNHVLDISELLDGKLLLQIRKPTSTVFESDTPLQIFQSGTCGI